MKLFADELFEDGFPLHHSKISDFKEQLDIHDMADVKNKI